MKFQQRLELNPPQPPEAWHPNYVHACHEGRWSIQYRHVSGKERGGRSRYRCNSRHHKGPCQDTWRRVLFARLQDDASAFQSCPPEHAMFWTLTFPAIDHRFTGERSRARLNRELGRRFKRFKDAINKRCRRRGWEPLQYFWIREAHRSGIPHMHLLVVHEQIAELLSQRDDELDGIGEVKGAERTLAPRVLVDMATVAGFGPKFDAQVAKSRAALAGYASKICALADERDATLAGELTKGSQVPEYLPRSCRSFGYSKGFVAPRKTNPEWTGWLENEDGEVISARRQKDDELDWLPEAARLAAEAREAHELGGREGPVYDKANPLAFFPTHAEASAFAVGDSFDASRVARTYRLQRDLMFTRDTPADEWSTAHERARDPAHCDQNAPHADGPRLRSMDVCTVEAGQDRASDGDAASRGQ